MTQDFFAKLMELEVWGHKGGTMKPSFKNALEAIEKLVSDDFAEDICMLRASGKLRGRNKEMAARIGKIYKIAHGFNPSHSCYQAHKNWRKLC